MDDDDFEAWKICWDVNLLFYERVTIPQTCIICSQLSPSIKGYQRSNFWRIATRCSAGHCDEAQPKRTQKPRAKRLQESSSIVKIISGGGAVGRKMAKFKRPEEPCLGVCATCDQRYMFNVVKGKYACRTDGCRRVIRVNESIVEKKLAGDWVLLENFRSLVRKCTVYECAVHGDEVTFNPDLSMAFKPPTRQCDHDRNICDPCLNVIYAGAIRSGRLEDLICPDPECKKPVAVETIRLIVSADVFKMYSKQLALKTMSQDERFRWCKCGHGQIHGLGESNPEWICLSCKKRHCYICRDETSELCTHLQRIDAQKMNQKELEKQAALQALDRASKRVSEKEDETIREKTRTTKTCPKAGCGNRIERNGGCGHFTCRRCKTEFCWCCKVIWENKRPLHLAGCRIGSKSTIDKRNLVTSGYAAKWDVDVGYDLSLDAGVWLITGHQ